MSSYAHKGERIGLAALVVAAGLTVAGCADLARVTRMSPQAVDPASPVAEEVLQASRRPAARPRFRDVPPTPTDARPPAAFAAQVAASEAERQKLAAWVAANPAMVPVGPQAAEAFAAGQRARIPAEHQGADLPPAGSEEFAARLRDLATPPPPPN
jgi:hypothetical protein